ncbi:F0F1 ATP synthase subunit B [Salisediminibacterium halotolerans]|uniref:F0F1 ATP synthase subunit B n=1 Tax=Salisediminibacterium halotolerans TaxID=517425 RepID=UPI000EB02326|nr:F0F1 ATP synthase subunit B [Salisediminibacterium halotolerans]RLJ75799.1 ATP synthase F0 subcomplex B subunit [Actinophytocola xinjiangensis]RPE89653.1 ATP synthase F0 subcomplex B subunit [Salisediminibacterium halotolerans]TWG36412.1 ATP synthase F0 subcomplex B subunit [Salisediminibacterium halotolerans]GEL08981.1 ATP synthase subunit b [Salisediminibacterium halotolerans]
MFDIYEIEWVNAVYQILGFLVLLFLLKKFAFGPIMDMMEKREAHIAEQIQSAEKNRDEAEKHLKEQREAIQEARQEAREIVENSRKQSEQQANEIIEEARKKAEREQRERLAEIEREKEEAVNAIREQVSSLSVLVASKVIEKELDEKEQEKLIEDTLKEVGGDL